MPEVAMLLWHGSTIAGEFDSTPPMMRCRSEQRAHLLATRNILQRAAIGDLFVP
jgi:hypothetical protein